jgi:hypothetical protein
VWWPSRGQAAAGLLLAGDGRGAAHHQGRRAAQPARAIRAQRQSRPRAAGGVIKVTSKLPAPPSRPRAATRCPRHYLATASPLSPSWGCLRCERAPGHRVGGGPQGVPRSPSWEVSWAAGRHETGGAHVLLCPRASRDEEDGERGRELRLSRSIECQRPRVGVSRGCTRIDHLEAVAVVGGGGARPRRCVGGAHNAMDVKRQI